MDNVDSAQKNETTFNINILIWKCNIIVLYIYTKFLKSVVLGISSIYFWCKQMCTLECIKRLGLDWLQNSNYHQMKL